MVATHRTGHSHRTQSEVRVAQAGPLCTPIGGHFGAATRTSLFLPSPHLSSSPLPLSRSPPSLLRVCPLGFRARGLPQVGVAVEGRRNREEQRRADRSGQTHTHSSTSRQKGKN